MIGGFRFIVAVAVSVVLARSAPAQTPPPFMPGTPPSYVGQWDPLFSLPDVEVVHLIHLPPRPAVVNSPSGEFLVIHHGGSLYRSLPQHLGQAQELTWFDSMQGPVELIVCSGHAALADGRILIAGGEHLEVCEVPPPPSKWVQGSNLTRSYDYPARRRRW